MNRTKMLGFYRDFESQRGTVLRRFYGNDNPKTFVKWSGLKIDKTRGQP